VGLPGLLVVRFCPVIGFRGYAMGMAGVESDVVLGPASRLPAIGDCTVTVGSGNHLVDDICGIPIRTEACIHGLTELIDMLLHLGGSGTGRLAVS
jgi:hypothetical protein